MYVCIWNWTRASNVDSSGADGKARAEWRRVNGRNPCALIWFDCEEKRKQIISLKSGKRAAARRAGTMMNEKCCQRNRKTHLNSLRGWKGNQRGGNTNEAISMLFFTDYFYLFFHLSHSHFLPLGVHQFFARRRVYPVTGFGRHKDRPIIFQGMAAQSHINWIFILRRQSDTGPEDFGRMLLGYAIIVIIKMTMLGWSWAPVGREDHVVVSFL